MTGRRELLLAGLTLPMVGAALAADSAVARPRRPSLDTLPKKIAFGSCANEGKAQPIWDAVLAVEPDLFIFLGDNIYGDTRDMGVLRAKYAQLAAQPGFRKLCSRTPVLATWDDHDYGENDAGAEYPQKKQSQGIFCDFWGEPNDSLRRVRDGIYDAVVFSAEGRRVQVILPDLRFNRTPIRTRDLGGLSYKAWAKKLEDRGEQVPGPYERNPDPRATMLGAAQWQWLESQLSVPADLRIFASSLQVVADFPGWEAWINYADDHQRLLQSIRDRKVNGLICISGDTHYAEISRLDLNAAYPLWDITSSGLTEVWPVTPPNSRRVGPVLREQNFGLLSIDWQASQPVVTAQAFDRYGKARLEQKIMTASLRPE